MEESCMEEELKQQPQEVKHLIFSPQTPETPRRSTEKTHGLRGVQSVLFNQESVELSVEMDESRGAHGFSRRI